MNIETCRNNSSLRIKIDGRVDTITSPMMEENLKNNLNDDISELVFDFHNVEYISSAGIRVIMSADKIMSRQGTMKLINVNEEIEEIFEMTGLSEILIIENNI